MPGAGLRPTCEDVAMKTKAEQCDRFRCESLGVMDQGEDIPFGWLHVSVTEQGNGPILDKTFCSKDCLLLDLAKHFGQDSETSTPLDVG